MWGSHGTVSFNLKTVFPLKFTMGFSEITYKLILVDHIWCRAAILFDSWLKKSRKEMNEGPWNRLSIHNSKTFRNTFEILPVSLGQSKRFHSANLTLQFGLIYYIRFQFVYVWLLRLVLQHFLVKYQLQAHLQAPKTSLSHLSDTRHRLIVFVSIDRSGIGVCCQLIWRKYQCLPHVPMTGYTLDSLRFLPAPLLALLQLSAPLHLSG